MLKHVINKNLSYMREEYLTERVGKDEILYECEYEKEIQNW